MGSLGIKGVGNSGTEFLVELIALKCQRVFTFICRFLRGNPSMINAYLYNSVYIYIYLILYIYTHIYIY